MHVAEFNRLTQLSLHETSLLGQIVERIEKNRPYNRARRDYYEAHQAVKDLGIATPPQLRNTLQAVGWPGLVVDALEERLDLKGMTLPGLDLAEYGIDKIWADNELELLYSEAHIDALVHGVAFLTASTGADGEPDPLITFESPENFSGIYDPRRRSLTAAAGVAWGDNGRATDATLYIAGQTIKVKRINNSTDWTVVHREEHDLPRPMVRRLVNRSRGSRQWGRSEITRPIISYTASAMRTLLGAEVAREFYAAPQRYILGADEKAFQDAAGNQVNPWKSYMGRFLALTADEDATELPKVGEFGAASPTPYVELVKMYSQLVAGEASLPAHYLGFVTENPASADQIHAVEARHVKRAERRQSSFGVAWRGIVLDAILVRDGAVPEELTGLHANWSDASTPTKAAAGDRAMKLVGSQVIPATSDVLLEELGYDEAQIARIKVERRAATGDELAQLLRANALAAAAGNPTLQQMASRNTPAAIEAGSP